MKNDTQGLGTGHIQTAMDANGGNMDLLDQRAERHEEVLRVE